jgi:energy-converting hydrogenase Eha subunit A
MNESLLIPIMHIFFVITAIVIVLYFAFKLGLTKIKRQYGTDNEKEAYDEFRTSVVIPRLEEAIETGELKLSKNKIIANIQVFIWGFKTGFRF